MSFVSVSFIVFLAAAVILYYLVPKKIQYLFLLAAGYVFYLSGGVRAAAYLLVTTASTYFAAIILSRLNKKRDSLPEEAKAENEALKKKKKLTVALSLILNFGILFVLKYLGFAAESIFSLLSLFGINVSAEIPSLLLPLGISFFIFQSSGYVIDVYRGKYDAERNFLKYSLFTSFFPQMVQGPISRFDELGVQLYAPHPFNADNIRSGIQLMMWGYFKKMVIADRAAVIVTSFFADYGSFGGAVTAFSILMYCINLYCDFSGGIDITRGAAELFGIHLAENFKRPIFALSLSEYWRRWHITLGDWMRDYVFYPISLSKPFAKLGIWSRKKIGGKLGKILPTSLATFIVYIFIGIWHGASLKYIAYGFWNGAIITSSLLLANVYHRIRERLHVKSDSVGYKAFCIIRTSFIVFIGRYITRSPRLLVGLSLIARTFTPSAFALSEITNGVLLEMGLAMSDYIVIALSVAAMLVFEFYEERRGSVRDALSKKGAFIQWLGIVIPILVILFFGIMRGSYISSEFIYKQY